MINWPVGQLVCHTLRNQDHALCKNGSKKLVCIMKIMMRASCKCSDGDQIASGQIVSRCT